MKHLLKILIPLALIIGAVLFFRQQFSVTVPVGVAREGTALNAVTGTVEVWSYADIRVKAEIRGQISELKVKAGDVVEEGTILAVQASEQLKLQIEQVRIRLEAAKARTELESTHKIDLESLQEELEGAQLAVELGQAAGSRVESLLRESRKREVLWRMEEIQEREQVDLLTNQLEQMELQQEQMQIRAPFDGIIAEINAFKGDLLAANQNLVRLVAHGRFLMMELTEEDYFGVEDGQEVTLRLASYPDRTFSGTVTRLEDVANANTKTRNLVVSVDAPDSILVPGLSGEGYLVKDERPEAVLIPRRALIGNLVYVVDDGVVDVRRVRPGYLGLSEAEIIEGIEVGDQVILEDQNLVQPGDRVEVEEPN
jgi:RND family efflux transporter MFP subunit